MAQEVPLWDAKIVKCVTKICNAFLVHRLAERDEISHDDGHWCVDQVIYSQLFREHKFSTANISHTFCRSSTKFVIVRGLDNGHMFPKFGEL